MKKIKLLLGIITVLILAYLLNFSSYFFLSDFYIEVANLDDISIVLGNPKSSLDFGTYNVIIGIIQSIFIFFGLVISFKCIYGIIKRGFFTKSSKKLMHYAGVIFLLSGIIAASLDIIRLLNNANAAISAGIILMDFLLALLGFIILIISDMSHVGFEIKKENELTI